MVIIPTADFPSYFESVILDNVPFVFGFRWNTRDNAWVMSIKREDVTLLSSIKIVNNFLLTDLYVSKLLPAGVLISIDVQKIGTNPNRNELGSAVKIAYITEDEVNSGTF